MLLFRSKGPRIAHDRAREDGYKTEGQPEPRWVTVGGHPAYQATYRCGADGSTVTELLTLDRVLSVGRAAAMAWIKVNQDPKNVPSVSRLVLIKFVTSEGQTATIGRISSTCLSLGLGTHPDRLAASGS